MFDYLGPIGAINTPDGSLEYGNVGATDCIYLRYSGLKDVVPCLIYTADELKALLDIVRQGETLAQRTEAGQIIVLGVMPAKPITLRLALVHPREGPPFLLLRMLQGNWKTDIVTGGFAEFARLLEVGVGPTQRPLQGPLKRRPDGGWRVAGKDLELLQGLSPGAGRFGEYLHPNEVREGEVVEVWTFGHDGKDFVATFRTRSRWRPPARVENREGQEGDNLLFTGQVRACQEVHEALGRQMMKSGRVDATWASKLTLTALVRAILSGQDEVGHAIWLGRSPEPILQIGLKAIEAGQTSIQDARLYHQLSCYYHSLNPNQAEAARAIDGIMASVFQSLEPKDWQEKRLT